MKHVLIIITTIVWTLFSCSNNERISRNQLVNFDRPHQKKIFRNLSSEDKLSLWQDRFQNFLIQNECPKDYESLIKEILERDNLNRIFINKIGN